MSQPDKKPVPNSTVSNTVSSYIGESADSKHKKPQSDFPLSGDSLREQVLKAGGVTVEQLGWYLRIAIMKAKEKLSAKQTVYAKYQGSLGESAEIDDNSTQLASAKMLLELAGAFPTRFQDGGKDKTGVVIHVHLPWQGKENDKEVIEAQGSVIPADKGADAT